MANAVDVDAKLDELTSAVLGQTTRWPQDQGDGLGVFVTQILDSGPQASGIPHGVDQRQVIVGKQWGRQACKPVYDHIHITTIT